LDNKGGERKLPEGQTQKGQPKGGMIATKKPHRERRHVNFNPLKQVPRRCLKGLKKKSALLVGAQLFERLKKGFEAKTTPYENRHRIRQGRVHNAGKGAHVWGQQRNQR